MAEVAHGPSLLTFPIDTNFVGPKTVGDVLADKGQVSRICDIHSQATVEEALNLLRSSHIESLPVYENLQDGGKKYTGILDVFDLLENYERVFGELQKHSKGLIPPPPQDEREAIKQRANEFFNRKVGDLVGLSQESMQPLKADSKDRLLDVMRHLAQGWHRALVVPQEGDNREPCYLSQLHVIHWLWQNRESVGMNTFHDMTAGKVMQEAYDLGHEPDPNQPSHIGTPMPISSMGATPRPKRKFAIYALSNVSALLGFRIMTLHRVHGIAILCAKTKKLVGTLQAADLRYLSKSTVEDSLLNVLDYLAKARPEMKPQDVAKVHSVTKDATLAEMCERILEHKLHRLFVVENDCPVGIVTLTDIINLFVPSEAKEE